MFHSTVKRSMVDYRFSFCRGANCSFDLSDIKRVCRVAVYPLYRTLKTVLPDWLTARGPEVDVGFNVSTVIPQMGRTASSSKKCCNCFLITRKVRGKSKISCFPSKRVS